MSRRLQQSVFLRNFPPPKTFFLPPFRVPFLVSPPGCSPHAPPSFVPLHRPDQVQATGGRSAGSTPPYPQPSPRHPSKVLRKNKKACHNKKKGYLLPTDLFSPPPSPPSGTPPAFPLFYNKSPEGALEIPRWFVCPETYPTFSCRLRDRASFSVTRLSKGLSPSPKSRYPAKNFSPADPSPQRQIPPFGNVRRGFFFLPCACSPTLLLKYE